MLALELMLALIKGREEEEPVPVRLSLAEWDTTTPLLEWLASHLVDVYGWPAKMAHKLVRQRRVLPVLDGLDEMDPTAPEGTTSPDAPRAQAALEALNSYQNGLEAGPVILTCRTRHYEALGERMRLLDAARIDIDHVTAPTAHAYLRQRARDPARWQPVLEALEADPTGTLATTLSTPWRLSLAATVYAKSGDPSDLLRHATLGDLDEYLLARFIPAATALHPQPRSYEAGDVHRWLAHLAGYLDARFPTPGRTGATLHTDLVLHQLWKLAGPHRVRTIDALLTAVAILLPFPLAWASTRLLGPTLNMAVMLAVPAGMWVALVPVRPPAHVAWGRLCTLAGLRTLAVQFAIWLAFWLALLLGRAILRLWIVVGLGLVVGLTAGLAKAMRREPSTSARPRDVIRGDLLRGLLVGFLVGFATALLTGLAGPVGGFPTALAFGLGAGLTAGLTAGTQSGRRYLVFVLCSRRRLPMRLGYFLDWACAAGLLRFAGPAYQFRHRELQEWLARHPALPPV